MYVGTVAVRSSLGPPRLINFLPSFLLKRKKEAIEGKEGGSVLYSTTFYIGLLIEQKQGSVVGPRQLDISYPTQAFTNFVKAWEHFDESSMSIVVQHIQRSALPEYVYMEGAKADSCG
ncbi:hypothetical protein C8R43DRAFT_996503 [Mycena crocata]|nr:hypothetical protein C8R43DRAFT_996503 [Mycena crocata]